MNKIICGVLLACGLAACASEQAEPSASGAADSRIPSNLAAYGVANVAQRGDVAELRSADGSVMGRIVRESRAGADETQLRVELEGETVSCTWNAATATFRDAGVTFTARRVDGDWKADADLPEGTFRRAVNIAIGLAPRLEARGVDEALVTSETLTPQARHCTTASVSNLGSGCSGCQAACNRAGFGECSTDCSAGHIWSTCTATACYEAPIRLDQD